MKKPHHLIYQELKVLKTFNDSNISWLLALFGATTIVAPLLVGAYYQQLPISMLVSMGAMVFLYFPKKRLHQRLNTLVMVGFGMQLALLAGLLPPVEQWGMVPVIMLLVFVSMWLSRSYQLNAPGPLYFIIAGCVALLIPVPLANVPHILGFMAIGNIWAVMVVLVYSLLFLRKHDKNYQEPQGFVGVNFLAPVPEVLLITSTMGIAMCLALGLNLTRPYWVPICCMTILQMPTHKLAWQRLWQMIIGSSIGLFLVYLVFMLPLNPWLMCFCLWVALIFSLWLLLRHYFLAMVFITPMTIFLVEFSVALKLPQSEIIMARWLDIWLGVGCGMVGFYAIHSRWGIHLQRKIAHMIGAKALV